MNDSDNYQLSYEELREFEPFEWPGRELVEQENAGDWGTWFSQFDGWVDDIVQDATADVEPLAHAIAVAYIAECCAAGYAMPADFDETGDRDAAAAADEADITKEFALYLRTWQTAVAARAG